MIPTSAFARGAARLRPQAAAGRLREALGWQSLVLLAVLAVAAYLRLKGIAWGLPHHYLNPDESIVVWRAFRIAHGNPSPDWFLYPSLLFYLIAAVYWLLTPLWFLVAGVSFLSKTNFVVDQAPYILSARLLVAGFGIASVYLLYRLGREAYSPAAGLLAALLLAIEPLHVQYSHAAVTDVPATALALLALVLLVRSARGHGPRALAAGAFVAGLATSTKYNLGMLLVPAAAAAWFVLRDASDEASGAGAVPPEGRAARRPRQAAARRALRCLVAPMAVGFVVGTPFALLDPVTFVGDFVRQNAIVANGWLGFESVGNGYWYNLHANLTSSLGMVLLGAALAGLLWAALRRRRADLMLLGYVLVYYLYESSWSALQARYLLPVIPVLVLLAARLLVGLAREGYARRRVLALAAAGLLVAMAAVPLSSSIADDARLSGVDTRTMAERWVERHIKAGSLIAMESYGPPLTPRPSLAHFRAVGVRPVSYRIVPLQLPLPGENDDQRRLVYLRRRGVDYVIVSSQVYDRVLAASPVYPRQAAFYRRLDERAELVKVFAPLADQRGPVIKVYRL